MKFSRNSGSDNIYKLFREVGTTILGCRLLEREVRTTNKSSRGSQNYHKIFLRESKLPPGEVRTTNPLWKTLPDLYKSGVNLPSGSQNYRFGEVKTTITREFSGGLNLVLWADVFSSSAEHLET